MSLYSHDTNPFAEDPENKTESNSSVPYHFLNELECLKINYSSLFTSYKDLESKELEKKLKDIQEREDLIVQDTQRTYQLFDLMTHELERMENTLDKTLQQLPPAHQSVNFPVSCIQSIIQSLSCIRVIASYHSKVHEMEQATHILKTNSSYLCDCLQPSPITPPTSGVLKNKASMLTSQLKP